VRKRPPSFDASFVDLTACFRLIYILAAATFLFSGSCAAQTSLGFAVNLISPTLLPTASSAIVAGDFNGDDIPDLAIIGQQNTVTVLLGTGKGSFTAGSNPPTTASNGSVPVLIVAADFNGDGKLDLATVNSSNTLTFLQGNGDGTFSPTGTMSLPGNGFTYMLVGDFNGDGKPDIVLSSNPSQVPGPNPSSATPFNLTLLTGNGDGTFTQSTLSLSSINEGPIAVGDFNGDGKTDIVVGSEPLTDDSGNTGVITVLLSNGNGTFTPGYTQTTTGAPIAIAAADFDGNGKLDIIAGTLAYPAPLDPMGQYTTGSIELMGNGDGTFTVLPGGGIPGAGIFAVADFNGDGKPDLAVGTIGGNPIDNGGIYPIAIELGNGQGGFTASPALADFLPNLNGVPLVRPNSEQVLATADFSGDGHAGLAVIGSTTQQPGNEVAILLYPPAITLSPANQLPDGVINTPYNQTITASGGTPPYTFSAIGLPAGLSISTSGVVSGTPTVSTAAGFFTLTVQDSNPADPPGSVLYLLNIDSPGFSITPASTSATVSAGQSATYTLNLASIGGFTSNVMLTCSVVSGMDGACSLSPATVTLGQTASSVLTVTTKAATTSLNEPPAMPFKFGAFGRFAGAVSLAGICLIFFPKGKYRRLSVVVVGLFAAGLMAACGGNSQTTTTTTTTTVPGTPAGNYNISVTAMQQSSSSSSTPITQTTALTLIVQ
jgi:hypothetical protein